jgi:protein tyrosine phosphatase (PTP) superfamily phosphohydrolase (DUF442 family)
MKTDPLIALCLLAGVALADAETSWAAAGESGVEERSALPGFRRINEPGINNLFALGTNIFAGSTPDGDVGFESLAKLGVKTIITVDGAKPDITAAHKFGMRYVHLPHGYDGISTNVQLMLAKAGRELPGPIYVHCHHGQHRGPTAAAVICMADQGWSRERAEAFLVTAGTSTNYTGLYETVREFNMPSVELLRTLPDKFPETAKVSGLVDAMVGIDERWEHLKAVRAAGYLTPPDHPDIVPANETVILWEHFREARRLPEVVQHGEDMIVQFKEAEAVAKEAGRLLRLFAGDASPGIREQLNQSFDLMGRSCSICHKAFRNPAGIKSK